MGVVTCSGKAAAWAAAIGLLWLGLPAAASADTLFAERCAACHGIAGEGNAALGVPALAGQDATYLARQVENFLGGARPLPPGNAAAAAMLAVLRGLQPDQCAEAIATAAAMRPARVAAGVASGMRNLVSECTSCHGADLLGVPALSAPRLAGQDRFYLLSQLAAFRAGRRGMVPGDKFGRQMRAMALSIPGDDAVGLIAGAIAGIGH
jgi:cytochrome c oxidase subunit 2